MTATRTFLAWALAATALVATSIAIVGDASARGRNGGGHLSHRQHHGHHLHLRHHRHHHHRHFFTRFKPCVVWTRQGWTNVCPPSR